ncbi:hypothetical protein Cni_G20594 [Canna indica]|uniref:SANT domain-containing protein n=1 Tax=Canna indica TaxID=4628 RepID=A0AAQ3KNF8_9LILI|nr:hypothetical protein Cni_G20594 [Canna indica]
MDAAQMDCMEEQIAETYADQLHSPGPPARNGIFDEPLISPRIGDEYQAAIPPLVTELDRFAIQIRLSNTSNNVEVDHHVMIGLSIPIMWVHHEGGHTKLEQDLANHGEEHDESKSMDSSILEDKTSTSTPLQQRSEHKGYSPLPCSPFLSWTDDGKQSFLLGLYIFGKDLVQVNEFIECKKMGDILSYYYGNFYRSDAYLRWSELRKAKRRCILGHRIFTGRRQQELLSRVLPKVPKDAHDTILKAAKTLNEAKNSLQEFVCTLKKTIGMEALVEVIGIGKGKHDLTGILDPVRTNQSISTCPEIPAGKACSLLSTGDIIKFLTGDFRLSKAKSNDLFWEAIWPRLLARGWHSEQPVASKNSLVFIIPGIEKFSRKRHMKGQHYFDSVSDVLNKVSSDPSLLELETEGNARSNNARDENGCVMDTRIVQNVPFDRQHRSYLRPRVPIGNSEHMKFTIVDTSLGQGEEPFKVRELRSLPIDAFSNYNLLTVTGEVGSDSSEYSDDSSSEDQGHSDPDTSDNTEPKVTNKDIIGSTEHCTSENALTLTSKTLPINGHISDDQCFVQDAESHFSCRAKSEQLSYLAPIAKRRRLTAYKHERTGHRDYSFLKRHQGVEEGAQLKLGGKEGSPVTEPDCCHRDVHLNITASASTDKVDNSVSKEESCSTAATVEATFSNGTSQSRTLIDLNLPPNFSVDSENGEHLNSELAGSQHDLNKTTVNPPETNRQCDDLGLMEKVTEANVANGDQLPSSANSRRQSTRKRPPTTRALESLACGFLGTKRRGRGTNAS